MEPSWKQTFGCVKADPKCDLLCKSLVRPSPRFTGVERLRYGMRDDTEEAIHPSHLQSQSNHFQQPLQCPRLHGHVMEGRSTGGMCDLVLCKSLVQPSPHFTGVECLRYGMRDDAKEAIHPSHLQLQSKHFQHDTSWKENPRVEQGATFLQSKLQQGRHRQLGSTRKALGLTRSSLQRS